MRLETNRLVLREMDLNDFNDLYNVLADSDIMQHYPYVFDEQRVRKWINTNIKRYEVFNFGLWAVTLKENGKMIGDCGITMQNINGFIQPEIGYHINKKYQCKGYAGEASKACRDWTFKNTPFNVVSSYMKEANIPSQATAKSMGMVKTNEFIDDEAANTVVYSITREQWNILKNAK